MTMEETNGHGSTALVKVSHQTALEPRSLSEAITLCKMAVSSGLLPKAIARPESALMILMRGRELGLTAMQSFASINVIEGKTSMSAELIVAKVKQRRDVCRYFRFVDGDDKKAIFETHREGDPEPTTLEYTWEDAVRMKFADKDNYKKQPANMLRWRCAVALARLVYPELTLGLVDNDEAKIIAQESRVVDAEVIDATAVESLDDRVAAFTARIEAAQDDTTLKEIVAEITRDPAVGDIKSRVKAKYDERKKAIVEGQVA